MADMLSDLIIFRIKLNGKSCRPHTNHKRLPPHYTYVRLHLRSWAESRTTFAAVAS
uniref:Uncharacterized protein n=1 Tax=Physcomitrium patens TaxID=3218 RepID=A0A2K1INI1_PHYPA|nr:hypothetical protein PHYPA_027134 [Physcomitrium patens]